MKTFDLIIAALRALSTVAPEVIRTGHGDRVSDTLDAIATLGERGEEAVGDLERLVTKLKSMDGVDRAEKEALWLEIHENSKAIQDAVKDLRPASGVQDGDGGAAGGATGTNTDGGAGAGASGDAGGSGGSEQA